jgi:hypothetical protein
LRHLGAVDRDAGHRRHDWRQRGGAGDLRPVEHVLQAIPQLPAVPRAVLHLEHAAVELGGAHRDRAADLGGRKAGERVLALFERADDAVQSRKFSHFLFTPQTTVVILRCRRTLDGTGHSYTNAVEV